MSRFHQLRLLVSVVALLVALGGTTVYAAEGEGGGESDGGPSIQGVVSNVSGTTVTILGGAIVIDASGAAIVSENNDAPLTLADVQKGRVISVEGSGAGASFHAARITVEGPRSDGSLSGPLDSVDTAGNRISILGVSVTLTPDTIIENNGLPNGSRAALTPGTPADVEVVVVGNSLVATRVQVGSGPDGQH